jgi:hypothetical protein
VLTNEHGNPDTRVCTPQELQVSIIQDDIRFTTVPQDGNEYVDDNGARIRIQSMVIRVAETSRFNARGEPHYSVEVQGTFQIRKATNAVNIELNPTILLFILLLLLADFVVSTAVYKAIHISSNSSILNLVIVLIAVIVC